MRSTHLFVIGVIKDAGFAKAWRKRTENTPRNKGK
jgi:hypothetical protein